MVAFLARRSPTERALRRLPLARIAEASGDRVVRLEGTVETDAEPLTAPLSGRPCAYWRVEVDISGPTPNIRESAGQPVRVRDESGVVTVDLSAARVDAGARFDVRGKAGGILGRAVPPRLDAFLRAHEVNVTAFSRIVWGREFIVAAGDRVSCAGRVRRDALDGASDERLYRTDGYRLVLLPAAEHAVLVRVRDSDDDCPRAPARARARLTVTQT